MATVKNLFETVAGFVMTTVCKLWSSLILSNQICWRNGVKGNGSENYLCKFYLVSKICIDNSTKVCYNTRHEKTLFS